MSTFAAHRRKSDQKIQTVKEHIDQVGEFCENWGKKIGIPSLAKLAGLLHDMGKEKEAFQTYLEEAIEKEGLAYKKGTIDHASAGARYFYEKFHGSKSASKITAELLAMVIAYHHDELADYVDPKGGSEFLRRMNKSAEEFDYEESVDHYHRDCYGENELNELFMKAKQEVLHITRLINESQLGWFGMGFTVKYLYSCLIDADWLDTYLFMSNSSYEEKLAKERRELWHKLAANLEDHLSAFPRSEGIGRLRSEIADQCLDCAENPSGIYSLTVPTGGGKTLSSLRYALNFAERTNAERIVYVVPFLTIIDQNVKEVKKAIKPDEAGENILLEFHSNVIYDNQTEEFGWMTQRWDSPLIFTSMVQFLNTCFEGGRQSIRRLHQLANAVLIFDEVQAIPSNCINLFNMALNFLQSVCHTTIILCTATQPALERTGRPLIKKARSEMMKDLPKLFGVLKRVEVEDARSIAGYTTSQLGEFVLEKAHVENNALVILNTKKDVRKLFEEIRERNALLPHDEQFEVFYLTTNICSEHRLNVLDKLFQSLEKGRVICISTQLIEAGINISFNCVVRGLAGLDSIAQAAGRCNRHGQSSEKKKTYIVNLHDENLGKLTAIKDGQECSEKVLAEYKKEPANFDYDLLSPKAMERYFTYLYANQDHLMDFPIGEYKDLTIADLLNENNYSIDAYQAANGRNPKIEFHQAFRTAAKHFEVIPDLTTSVIVPYEGGEELISDINSEQDLKKLSILLKKAQRYSVNLFKNEMDQLQKNGGIAGLRQGMTFALLPQYYDSHALGVIPEGKEMEFMSY